MKFKLVILKLDLESGRTDNKVASRAKNGWTLTDHLNSSITISKINEGNWDYVVLQENGGFLLTGTNASWTAFNNAVANLTNIIHNQSPDAEVKLFQIPAPFHHASSNFNAFNANWYDNFTLIAGWYPGVEVTHVSSAFENAYTFWGTPGLGANGVDLLRDASSSYHFKNTGGFLAAVTFYADIYQDKPCVPSFMTFINGVGAVDVNVFNLEQILHVGYVTGYGFTLNIPPYGDCTMYGPGFGPCD